MSIVLKIRLYKTLVLSVLLYNVEIWGPQLTKSRMAQLEAFHRSNLKRIIMVNKKFPNDAVYFISGEMTIESIVRGRVLKFLLKFRDRSDHKNVKLFIPVVKDLLSTASTRYCKFVANILQIVQHTKENYFDRDYQLRSFSHYSKVLSDHFFMTLRNNMVVNTKLGFLNCYFQGPGPFQFLTKPLNSCARRNVINFIGGCHHLRVETGRWYAVPRPQRVCLFCPVACVEDETHSILYCESF